MTFFWYIHLPPPPETLKGWPFPPWFFPLHQETPLIPLNPGFFKIKSEFPIDLLSLTFQMNLDLPLEDGHVCNMGKMIEEMEGKLRNSLDQVLIYFLSSNPYLPPHSLPAASENISKFGRFTSGRQGRWSAP